MGCYNEKERDKGSPDGRALESTLPPSKENKEGCYIGKGGKEDTYCEDDKLASLNPTQDRNYDPPTLRPSD